MPYKEKDIQKRYFSISEVADMFSVAPSLIRFWETEFENLNPKKNSKGIRQYSEEDIQELKLIYHLVKEKGYTIAGAKDIIKQERGKAKSKMEAVESLKKVRDFLVELKSNLEKE